MKDKKYIRVGFFDDFKGEDSILISVDIHGLLELEFVFDKLSKEKTEIDLIKMKYVDPEFRMKIKMVSTNTDEGLIRKNGNFIWELSTEKWDEIRQKVTGLYRIGTKGHHYLDSDSKHNNDLQVVLSLNEYDKDFWMRNKKKK